MAQQVMVSRRICWPTPDATCLHGGCGYCNDSRFRSLKTIEAYAKRQGITHHRCNGEEVDAWTAYTEGYAAHFYNAEVRYKEVS